MTPELDRYLTQPRRERGGVVPPDGEWTPERRVRYSRWLRLARVAAYWRLPDPAIVNRLLFVKWRRRELSECDRQLLPDTLVTALVLFGLWRLWLGVGT